MPPPAERGFSFYEKMTEDKIGKIVIEMKRAIHPLKSFFTPAQRKVGEYFSSSTLQQEQEERIILGAKSCDLNALKISDSVYSGEKFGKEYKDPFYIEARRRTLIISSDCVSPDENCFCNMVGSKLFPEEGFDLNFSFVEEGFGVQIGSEKGESLIKEYVLFSSASQEMIRKMEKRKKVLSFWRSLIENLKQEYLIEKW